jgi:hypothetical protein
VAELLEPAAQELVDTAAWYESRRAGYGLRFLEEAEELFDLIDENPLLAPPWLLKGIPAGVRHLAMRTFPVSIVLVTEPRTVIVAIMGSQEPAYWIDRLDALE